MNKSHKNAVMKWRDIIIKKSTKYNLESSLIAAMILIESGGNPYAIRVEPAFWQRYKVAYHRILEKNTLAKKWLKYPDVFACSYGLMQIMYGVAVENGCRVKFPTELLSPEINIEYGCKILARKIKVKGDTWKGVLAYNGGGAPQYPSKVRAMKERIERASIF